jgi:hypothetical protein
LKLAFRVDVATIYGYSRVASHVLNSSSFSLIVLALVV